MAIFNKSAKPKIDRSNTTIIAAGTQVKGDIQIECKLHVDGEFTGSVHSNSVITVGKTGLLEGEIVAKKLVVTGRFLGNADCDEIDILSSGRVEGNLSSKVLTIERGSFFEGDSRLKDAGDHPRNTNLCEEEAKLASVAHMPSADTLEGVSEAKDSSENPGDTDLCEEEAKLVNVAHMPSADTSKNSWRF